MKIRRIIITVLVWGGFSVLAPWVCSAATGGGMVVSSFYTNIVALILIFSAGVMNAWYIMDFLRQKGEWSPKLASLASFWFFSGLTWLFFMISTILAYLQNGFYLLFYILGYHAVIGLGLSVTYHIIYKNFFRRDYAWGATLFIAFLGVIYSALQVTGDWSNVIQSDWGILAISPPAVQFMSFVMGSVFAAIALIDFFIRLYRVARRRTRQNINEFIIDLAIAVFFVIGMVEIRGEPGWRMVLYRMFLLAAFLLNYLAIYQTSYLPLSLKEEKVKTAGIV